MWAITRLTTKLEIFFAILISFKTSLVFYKNTPFGSGGGMVSVMIATIRIDISPLITEA